MLHPRLASDPRLALAARLDGRSRDDGHVRIPLGFGVRPHSDTPEP